MDVLGSFSTPNGESYCSTLTLAVKNSSSFTITSSAENISFSVISTDYFGSISGDGIESVTINTQYKTIDVDGDNISYTIISDAHSNKYDYFTIIGSNDSPFKIDVSQDYITALNLNIKQSITYIDHSGKTLQADDVYFQS